MDVRRVAILVLLLAGVLVVIAVDRQLWRDARRLGLPVDELAAVATEERG